MNILKNMKLSRKNESGNAVVMVLVVLVVVAVGALAYLSGQRAGEQNQQGPEAMAKSASASAQQANAASGENTPPVVIQPGNPVVAKVGDVEIERQDVFEFLQGLPPEARQQPVEELFPLALEQVINARVVEQKVKGVKLDNDAEVKERLAEAKKRIVQTVYVQKKVEEKITDERLQQAYNVYIENFPEVEEVKAAHILVDDKGKAKDLIEQLNEGADFAELAITNSKDATASNGGDLGFFLQSDVVPEFGEAAFAIKPGTFTKKPVKSEFGYHIIKVEEKRKRPPADIETVKPFLEAQLRQALLQEVVNEWRNDIEIERFGINGKEDAAPKEGDAG